MPEGIIIKAVGSNYFARENNGNIIECKIKGKMRIRGFRSTNPVVVGDRVVFNYFENQGLIESVLERKNYIIRKSINLSKQYHIIAANIDQAFLVVTLIEPTTPTDFIDRYLVSAEALRIPVILVFNKTDLYQGDIYEKFVSLKKIYENIGYRCLETSAIANTNVTELKDLMREKVSVINGNSGVGKSSLIKRINPDIDLKIGKVSDFHKTGIHTTSTSEMYTLNFGGYIIDTPGIRAFGLIDFEKEELYHFFPEIFKIASNCKFYNCTHIHEPDCAVIKGVHDNFISNSRYLSYYNLFHDKNEKYR